jgi:hypothetical protein
LFGSTEREREGGEVRGGIFRVCLVQPRGRRGEILMEGTGGVGRILNTFMFGSSEERGGEVRDFNYIYVWFTRGGEGF